MVFSDSFIRDLKFGLGVHLSMSIIGGLILFLEPVKNRREREILSDKATHLKKKRKKPFIVSCPWLLINC